jgi:hypothetical protein
LLLVAAGTRSVDAVREEKNQLTSQLFGRPDTRPQRHVKADFSIRCHLTRDLLAGQPAALKVPQQATSWERMFSEARAVGGVSRVRRQSASTSILLQKSFCTGDEKFCGLQARLSCKDVRDLIASR